MNRSQWADPSTEEAAEKHGWNQNDKTNQETLIETVPGESVRQANKRIQSEEEPNWVRQPNIRSGGGDGPAEFCPNEKKEEQYKEEDLRVETEPGWSKCAHAKSRMWPGFENGCPSATKAFMFESGELDFP